VDGSVNGEAGRGGMGLPGGVDFGCCGNDCEGWYDGTEVALVGEQTINFSCLSGIASWGPETSCNAPIFCP
jgi:hypothetical protein